jgi:hypothetical protein
LILPLALVPDANSPRVLGFYDPCCAHVVIAQHFMESGGWDEVVQRMPGFAERLNAVIETAKSTRDRARAGVGPPFHYPTGGA